MLLYLNLVLSSKAPAWLRWALSLNVSDAAGSNSVGLNAIRDQEISTRSYGRLNMFKLEQEKWHKL